VPLPGVDSMMAVPPICSMRRRMLERPQPSFPSSGDCSDDASNPVPLSRKWPQWAERALNGYGLASALRSAFPRGMFNANLGEEA